ncbi:MAG: cupin domain-containing protein [Candidatus Methylomirabilis oxygeniifera]|uniref:Acireductone dioxygenase n=1 Tax=Methylomirabilis oxygeniifera TaxID=671143 RepID=D5MLU3_METO1|nr:MAG: cupin domain-containing protein [Candidatus Methylomirabilis oxyfera]CBE70000.1 1,2-dihydroxy-3-keto-5-methylthiopentene dioxygenase (5-methylthio-3-oxo-1-penten-1,2-diol dioxygenase) (DHK-MTPene dioxygenase) [Candidatus Methylomirabilis oxyfera]
MATIKLHPDNRRIEVPAEMAGFLEKEGLVYRNWDVSKLREELRGNYALTEAEKAEILATFEGDLQKLKAEGGYVSADIVVLWDKTPDLETLLDKFNREHHHSEDEVRFVVDGHGIFTIRGRSGQYFDMMVGPGDLITVPAGTRHWFTLAEDRRIKCIRLFQDPAGWAAIYDASAGRS